MKTKLFSLIFGAALIVSGVNAQTAGSIAMTLPETLLEYQIAHVSQNGKWACGVITNEPFNGWVWNLESGELTELTPVGVASMAVQVSNEGVVAGTFMDTKATTNGAAVESAGYWKEGKWYHLNAPGSDEVFDYEGAGMANAISPNGRFIGGQMRIGGVATPVVWDLTSGEMKALPLAKSLQPLGSVFSVADNGYAAGWSYCTIKRPGMSDKTNRTAAIWCPDLVLPDTTVSGVEYYAEARMSHNGKKAVAYRTIYDIETGTKTPINVDVYTMDIFGVCDDGSFYGQYVDGQTLSLGGFIYTDGKFWDLTDYLKSQGVDMTRFKVAQVVGVSADKKTFGVMAYDMGFNGTDGAYKVVPVAFKLDENISTRRPAGIKAMTLEGANAVTLSWNAPLAGAEGVTGYELYRNGNKVATLAADVLTHTDVDVPVGEYSYSVKALYGETLSDATEAVNVIIAPAVLAAPQNFMAVQSHINDVRMLWSAPVSSLPILRYHNTDDDLMGWGWANYTVEIAVRYTAEMLAAYGSDAKIEGATFAPMSRRAGWKVNVYASDNTTTPLYTQRVDDSKLVYGVVNTIKFDAPVSVPAGKDIIVAVVAESNATTSTSGNVFGRVMGKKIIGYTDLVRRPNVDANFSSMYELSVNNVNVGAEDNGTWPIGLALSNAANSEQTVSHYIVYMDGAEMATSTTAGITLENISEGAHVFSVVAEYANGSKSEPVEASVKVANNYSSLNVTNLKATVNKYDATITWDAPQNDDATMISYATGDLYQNGLIGSADYNYSYTVAHQYSPSMVKAYNGYRIKGLRFLPLGRAYFAFYLYKDGKEILYHEIPEDGYTIGQWNTVELSEEIIIDATGEYTLELECFEPDPNQAPIALDLYASHAYSGDLYKQGAGNYESLGDSDDPLSGNWMIGMVIAGEPKPLALKGYKVYQKQFLMMGEKLLTPTPITETSYSFTASSAMNYTFRVAPVFDEPIGEQKGQTIVVNIDGTSGIEDIKSGDILSYAVFTLSGVKVAEGEGSNLDVQNLSNGVYMFKIKTASGEINRKAIINK